MYYIQKKDEQYKVLEKVYEFYKYNEISLKDLEFYKRFKYCIIFDESVTFTKEFISILEFSIDYFYDDFLYIFVPDIKYIESFKSRKIFPSVYIQKDDFKNKDKILDFICEYPFDEHTGDGMIVSAMNICSYSSTFNWVFSYNYETNSACFVSNDKGFLIEVKKKYKKFFKDPFIPIEELITDYGFARNREEFNMLPIAKIEII